MSTIAVSPDLNEARKRFFLHVFRERRGWVCLAFMQPGRRVLTERFFLYPQELPNMLEAINENYNSNNVYFCPQLLSEKKRHKDTIHECPTAWADLDGCDPSNMLLAPTVILESSPGRYQALWSLDEVEPLLAEEVSKRIAYFHAPQGADKSGWDLTQLLRVPFTYNKKYTEDEVVVRMLRAGTELYRYDDFDVYPHTTGSEGTIATPMPEVIPDHEVVLEKYKLRMPNLFWPLHQQVPPPEADWSKLLWQLELVCFEADMTADAVFSVAREAKCNKYRRDNIDNADFLLWKEVCRAEASFEETRSIIIPERAKSEPLLSEEEREQCRTKDTFVERYIRWASGLGDAASQYHQAGAFVALSSLLAGPVRLPTSFGIVLPNLWFMILADTTLTRKSTAMDIAMDVVAEVDPDAILATDGSIEGLMTSLSLRPGRPSIFLRDEFSGLLEAMTKKDYYAGMAETLTKLYDGKLQKRILRKEIIEVRDPVLVIFAGGIKNKVTSLLTHESVSSGFVPRFVFITAESDAAKVMPLGPPTEANLGQRQLIIDELADMVNHYNQVQEVIVKITGAKVAMPKRWDARMTPDAWVRYNQLEASMMKVGLQSEHPDIMTPTYDRLAKSALKAAVLIAASEQRNEEVIVSLEHMVHAIFYVEQWREHTHQVINNIGKGALEREMEKILTSITKHGSRTRSALMQGYHLTARQADALFSTLEQRGQIVGLRQGKGTVYYPVQSDRKGPPRD